MTPDLYALVIRLTAAEDGTMPVQFGHQAQGLFLDLVRQVDPVLAERLHADSPTKPYTVAALAPMSDKRQQRASVRRGATVALRVTLLEATLFQPFVAALLTQPPHASMRLGNLPLTLADVHGTAGSDAMAGFTSFKELADAACPTARITLQFVTPTAFSLASAPGERKRVALLPEPRVVFKSLVQRWNKLAPLQLDDALVEAASVQALVSDYQLRTTSYSLDKASQVGFLGRCTYELHGTAEERRLLALLADAVFYLGVGMKTARGMGACHRLRDRTSHTEHPTPEREFLALGTHH